MTRRNMKQKYKDEMKIAFSDMGVNDRLRSLIAFPLYLVGLWLMPKSIKEILAGHLMENEDEGEQ